MIVHGPMATMHQPDNDAGSGAADLSNGPDVVSNPANDTVNAGRWAAAVPDFGATFVRRALRKPLTWASCG